MQCARSRFLLSLVLGIALLSAIPMGAMGEEHVEYGLNREPNAQPLAFTNSEPGNETADEISGGENVVATWLLDESGSGSYTGDDCAGALAEGGTPGGPHTYTLAWGSERMFIPPEELDATSDDTVVTPLEDMNVTITLTGTDTADEPIATGDVTFRIEVGWIRPPPRSSLHMHGSWTGEASVSPSAADLPLPEQLPQAGVLPSSVQVPVPFSNDITRIHANSPLAFFLVVECESDALFNIQFGDIGEFMWVWGTPEEDDIDGDGLPDSLDTHPDGSEWSRDEQLNYGTDPLDPNDTPGDDSVCPGYTIQEAKDANEGFQRDDPDTCPDAGGLNWLLLLLALLLVVGLAGGAFGAVTTVNKKIRMTISHDGFQDIAKGESARYELLLTAKGKEDEEVPVELSLKGVPEDWSATVEPAHLTLIAGEEAEAQTAVLTVTPPPEEEYEAEAVVTATATPTDEDGKTSPMKPGTSVKSKTIVNIDVEPPEGEKRKKVKKPKPKDTADEEALTAQEEEAPEGEEEDSGGKGKFAGALGLLKRKGKKEESEEEAQGEEGAEPASEDAEAGTAAVAEETGKPDLKVGEMSHEPADFSAGDEVTTTVPVKNSGDAPVEGLLLRLYVNDDRVDEQEVDLQPGDTTEVLFTWTAQPDENRVRVRGGLKEA